MATTTTAHGQHQFGIESTSPAELKREKINYGEMDGAPSIRKLTKSKSIEFSSKFDQSNQEKKSTNKPTTYIQYQNSFILSVGRVCSCLSAFLQTM